MSDALPTLAGYRLEQRIGVGGMAEVFRARREGPGGFAKQVAIKRVLPDLTRDPQWVDMFLEEARLAARFSCRNLIQVFDFGEADGAYYLAMEYVDGIDLATLLAAGPLPAALVAHLGLELCEALDHLHRACDDDGQPLGVVHRDVTPGNVLISIDGEVKLGDFGIAHARARAIRTADGAIKGKLAYLSPEQTRNDPVDARTDLYGLGLCLFEALEGRRYLFGDDEVALLRLAEAPPFAQIAGLDRPAAVKESLGRALAVEPARRFTDAGHFAEALRSWSMPYRPDRLRRQLGERVTEVRARPITRSPAVPRDPERAPEPARAPEPRTEVREVIAPRSRATAILAVAGLGVVVGLAVLLYPRWRAAEPTSTRAVVVAADAGGRDDSSDAASTRTRTPIDAGTPPSSRPTAIDGGRSAPPIRSVPIARPTPVRPPATPTAIDAGIVEMAAIDAGAPASRATALLAAIDQTLTSRGLLARDVPRLYTRHRQLAAAIAGGDNPVAELLALQQEIAGFVIDRTFIDSKLQRLDKELRSAALDPAVALRLDAHAQRALSHGVNGRYDLANRELNAIAAVVEP